MAGRRRRGEARGEKHLEAGVGNDDVLVNDVPTVLRRCVPGQVLLPHLMGHVAVGALEDLLSYDLLRTIKQVQIALLRLRKNISKTSRPRVRSSAVDMLRMTTRTHVTYPVARVEQVAGDRLGDEVFLRWFGAV